jgi:hypothetical protein
VPKRFTFRRYFEGGNSGLVGAGPPGYSAGQYGYYGAQGWGGANAWVPRNDGPVVAGGNMGYFPGGNKGPGYHYGRGAKRY